MIVETIEHRKGRRLYGLFITQDNGRRFYCALRRHKEIYCDRKASLSEALRRGTAGWAVDVQTIIEARSRACDYIVVLVKDTREIYVTHLESFLPSFGVCQTIDWTSRGGSSQRVVPLSRFEKVEATITL